MEREKSLVLIVDDMEANREVMAEQVESLGYECVTAENGEVALTRIASHAPDVILLDLMMPVLDGFATLERILHHQQWRDIPVIIISSLSDVDGVVRCLERGAVDYLSKPANMQILRARLEATLRKKKMHDLEVLHQQQMEQYNHTLEGRVRQQVRTIVEAQTATIFALSKLAESRDMETGQHLERMREFCRIVAEDLAGLKKYQQIITPDFIEVHYAASPLHDVGKVGIPDEILRKPGKLTREEFEVMKTHTIIGAETLRAVDRKHPGNSFIQMGIEIAESHHEKWDGKGYPHGLSGTDIPLSARILALADVYDALTTKRCYKEEMSHETAKDIILESRGRHFDPDMVDAFLNREEAFRQVAAMTATHDTIEMWKLKVHPPEPAANP